MVLFVNGGFNELLGVCVYVCVCRVILERRDKMEQMA